MLCVCVRMLAVLYAVCCVLRCFESCLMMYCVVCCIVLCGTGCLLFVMFYILRFVLFVELCYVVR